MSKLSGIVTKDKLLYFANLISQKYARKEDVPKAYTLPTASAETLGGVKIGKNLKMEDGVLSAEAAVSKVSELANDSGFQTKSEVEAVVAAGLKDAVKDVPTKEYVDGKVSSVYKPAGSVSFDKLPALSEEVLNNVYNVTNSFNTTADFTEGAGKSHPAGTNVAVVKVGDDLKFDAMAGFVDLSGYQKSADLVEITNAEIDAMFS